MNALLFKMGNEFILEEKIIRITGGSSKVFSFYFPGISDEFRLWEAVQRWLVASSHPERRGNTASPLMASIIPFIKLVFPNLMVCNYCSCSFLEISIAPKDLFKRLIYIIINY